MERKKLNIWTASSFFIFLTYLVFLVYPIVTVLKQALIHEGQFSLANFVTFFSKAYYSETLVNSFRVSITATVTSLVVGTLLAYLFSMYDFKGKKFLQILIIIASMSAPFVGAYSWVLLLGRNGVITKFLTNALHLPAIDIYGFKGIVLVFTLQLFPLVFLYVAGTMNSIDNSLLEAAESMGSFGFKPIVTVVLPLLVPTLTSSSLLVFMRAFSDFGTPMLIGEGYRTFPVLIYTQFISEVGGNSAFAIMAIIIALAIFLIQKHIANRYSFSMNLLHPIEPKKTTKGKMAAIYATVYGIIFISVLPQIYLIYTSFLKTSGMVFVKGYSPNSYKLAFNRMGSAIFNTIRIPLIALVLVVLFATFISYLAVRKRNLFTNLIDSLSMVPYIVPGTVLGIAFISSFNTGLFGSGFLMITGTAFILIMSLSVRRLPYTIRSSVASLQQIAPSIEEAAESLGSSRLNTFAKITTPMMLSGIISGAILSWVTMISKLSTSILLYNVKTRTMTVAIYTEVLRGNYGVAAALSTILTVLTVGSLLLFMKISKSNSIIL
ncbi:iron ABC transporter permease [Streptococcus pneumoniae]|uniref:ABC transporter permease n=2 Tax=Streptococcus pneumoniae TaxID=1313 RepID=UPI0005DACA09|nr:iron ABC transporter permease [Streptococcus pneumoniae]CIQ00863.1 iron ABC transporter permease [Streptococcus pneumoniae]CIV37449.1 iron ABC transporter permease [Streptococcus pneumoniae]CIX22703.1 iron ABC transporter permease [Streptococcus pneumoniae]COK82436.1 iron ABC transporter permease [Streptococcus pneumoniae]CON18318.1 iron ABC transporter permease [Streptococcus pneumoniae]